MIDYIRGIVAQTLPGIVIIDTTGGVGYRIHTSTFTSEWAGEPDQQKVPIYLHTIKKMDMNKGTEKLFGFARARERDLTLLIADKVQGVGVGTAMNLWDTMDADGFEKAVSTKDLKFLTSAKHIGKTAAQRMISELADYFNLTEKSSGSYSASVRENARDAAMVLTQLGWKKSLAISAVTKAYEHNPSVSAEELIKLALGKK